MSRPSDARFSTYSGAPSLQPSLAPTYASTAASARNSAAPPAYTQQQNRRSQAITEEKRPFDPSASTATLSSSDPKAADIKSWSGALERLQDARLEKQRYTMSSGKSEEVSMLALGAKVERALSRRMVGQDATFSSTTRSKKSYQTEGGKEVEAN